MSLDAVTALKLLIGYKNWFQDRKNPKYPIETKITIKKTHTIKSAGSVLLKKV